MEFFVYGNSTEDHESAYAKLSGREENGNPQDRIAKVHFRHNNEEFLVEVGKPVQLKRYRGDSDRFYWIDDGTARVVAIVQSVTVRVHTDKGQSGGGKTEWNNPFDISKNSIIEWWSFATIDA